MMAVQAQVSRWITERRNSMIARPCACPTPEVFHHAYLRELLGGRPGPSHRDATAFGRVSRPGPCRLRCLDQRRGLRTLLPVSRRPSDAQLVPSATLSSQRMRWTLAAKRRFPLFLTEVMMSCARTACYSERGSPPDLREAVRRNGDLEPL
jgi:hypothetical protein